VPWAVLGNEGFRLFFPLAAIHAATWPFLWVVLLGFDLPFAQNQPPSLTHAHEMLIGSFGAALIGFMTTAVPEWTGTAKLQHRRLFILAALWGSARVIGLLGLEPLMPVAAVCDVVWLGALAVYVAAVSWQKRTTRLLGFVLWIAALGTAVAHSRIALLSGDVATAQGAIHLSGFVFLGLLGLALSRITVPVTNRVLDPTEATTPFRPHPGRMHLAPALVAIFCLGEATAAQVGLSDATRGFLAIAAGAAFLDRVAEGFIGRLALRGEILCLAGASALAGIGLLMLGANRLGAPVPEVDALHIAFMGGLGLGALAVLSIAGLAHTGQAVRFTAMTNLALALLVAAVALRVLPDLDLIPQLPGPEHGVASLVWAAAFLIWLHGYWPAISDPATIGKETC